MLGLQRLSRIKTGRTLSPIQYDLHDGGAEAK